MINNYTNKTLALLQVTDMTIPSHRQITVTVWLNTLYSIIRTSKGIKQARLKLFIRVGSQNKPDKTMNCTI